MQDVNREKYHILYTTSFSYMAGGGQWSLYYLIKHLNKDLFHPIVLCPEEGELAEKMQTVGADIIYLNVGRIRHLNLCVIKRLVTILKEREITLIHTDSSAETFYTGISARLMRIPLIWHIRATEEEWFLDRFLSCLSTKLILVAKVLISRFKWLEDSPKLIVIYNGVDIDEFDAFSLSSSIRNVRNEFNISQDTVLLGCIARIEEKKGQEYLVSSMGDVDNAKLILVGSGEKYLDRIKKLCDDIKISEKVIFAGQRKDIPSLLREIDIVVSPSLTEAFSRVILEAMSAGRPVIATRVGGNPEAVVDGINGYIVPAKNPIALASRINKLVSNKEKREKMGLAGRERVEKMFTIEGHIRAVERLYKEILGR